MRRPDTGVPAVSAYEGPAVQRQPIEEEEKMLQAKAAETIQRQPIEEEEEELQMKSAGGSAGGHATATSVLPKGEADQVADQVMRMPQPRGPTSIQRLCPQCEEEAQRQPATEEEMEEAVQRAPSGKAAPAMTNRAQKAIHTPSAGTRLNPNVRSRVEPVLGRLMSDVRVHADDRSQQAAADIHAKAFTHKNHIFLGPGQSGSDLSLIAHEATHVVQQLGRGQQAGGKPGAVQRQDDESWSLEGLARTGREIYDAGAELVDDAVELGEEAVDTGRSIYRRGRRLYRRGRRVAEGVRQEAIVGAQGDESLHRITFDGSQVQVTGTPDFSAPAVSGLQPHARDARGIDYTNPIYQDQPNLGPIPEGEYYILPSEMQSSAAHGFNLSAWGRFRVILHPTALAYQHRVVLGRGGGFYLHEDANHNGTAGCIGLLNTRDNRVLLERIQNATSSVPVTVRYNSAPAPSEDSAAADCPECTPPSTERELTHPQASTATNITEAEGAWEAAAAALDPNGGEIHVMGEGLRRVRNNRGTRHAWHQLMRQILEYRFDERGRRMDFFRPARAIAYGGNYFNPGDYFTTGTWLIGNCYPTAQFELSYCKPDGEGGLRGIVHAVWIIHDELDLEPGRGRGPVYNTGGVRQICEAQAARARFSQ